MARKAGQGEEEEVAQSQEAEREKTLVRHEEKKPACHGGGHHVVEQGGHRDNVADDSRSNYVRVFDTTKKSGDNVSVPYRS
ncbi:hypothetical protein STEG23_029229 [Scotinomys teguina]